MASRAKSGRLSTVNGDELLERLDAWSLGRVRDAVVALAAPTIWLHVQRAAEEDIPVGASKVGGLPDLPEGIEWPAWHEPMAFLAQVNLAEVAPHDAEQVLPDHGLLSFFYETDGEPLYAELWRQRQPRRAEDYPKRPDPRSWRVLYLPDSSAPLARRAVPSEVNRRARYAPCSVRCSPELSIPDPDTLDLLPLGLGEAERRAYINLYCDDWSPNRGSWDDPGNRLLGHPFTLGSGSSLVECDYAARGAYSDLWTRIPEQDVPIVGREAARRWRLLLQIDSGEAAEMDWAGGGVLHFCIEHSALAQRDFSRVWLNMQFM